MALEDDDLIIDPVSECHCCPEGEVPVPDITRVTCGHTLSLGNFDASVRGDIPDEAVDEMTWLDWVRFRNAQYDVTDDNQCESGGSWYTRDTLSVTAGEWVYSYDPEDDCSLGITASGAIAETTKYRDGACDDPPDNEVTYERSIAGTLYASGVSCLWDYTGTDDGDPVSGTKTFDVYDATPSCADDAAVSLDVGSSPVEVVQSVSNAFDCEFSGGFSRLAGSFSYESGYSNPDDYRLEIGMPDGTEGFYQIRAKLYFTPSGGSESEAGTIEVDWKTGDEPATLEWEFTAVGAFRLGPVSVRRGRYGRFTKFDVEP